MTTQTPYRAVELDIITRTLQNLAIGGTPAHTMFHLEQRSPMGSGHAVRCLWHGDAYELAALIHRRLFGRPRPAAVQPVPELDETARQLSAYIDLQSQRWYPPQAGDLVHIAYEATETTAAFGETYEVRHLPYEQPGLFQLGLVHHTSSDPNMVGMFAPGQAADPLLEIWTEAGAARVTVQRDGLVVHNGPNRRMP